MLANELTDELKAKIRGAYLIGVEVGRSMRWIPVESGLPHLKEIEDEDFWEILHAGTRGSYIYFCSDPVLVLLDKPLRDGRTVGIGQLIDDPNVGQRDLWVDLDGAAFRAKVTHWQPLPGRKPEGGPEWLSI